MDEDTTMEIHEEESSESDDSCDEDMTEEPVEAPTEGGQEVYLPGHLLQEGEELVCDQSAYVMLHQAQSGAPCLSFDIIKDTLGDQRDTYPLTAYIVAGTQAAKTHANSIIVMKMSNLQRTSKEADEDDEDDESDDDEQDESQQPVMAAAAISHKGCVNRIRSTVVGSAVLAASWSELGRVNVWNLTQQLQAVDDTQLLAKYNKDKIGSSVNPVFSFTGHQTEGYALDWCGTAPGVLATGDCRRDIHIWTPSDGASSFVVDQRPLQGHSASVEDIQWSPNERHVLASCSVDRSIRIWDTRAPPSKACMLTADNVHESDVNVIGWNRNEPFIASGGDDGFIHIFDLRQFQTGKPVATFKHHTEPVTTIEWHPHDATVFASGGADNQIALWDLSVERDTEGADLDRTDVEDLPPQLLFIHQGQTDIKELHWHQQIPGVILSTANSGFNIFRTISV